MKETKETNERTAKTRKRKYFNVIELSKKINRTQNPGLLEDVNGIFTHLLLGPLISHEFRLPLLGQLKEVFGRHNYTRMFFLFNHRENGFDVYFQYDDPNKGKSSPIFSSEDADDFYWISVRNRTVAFQYRHGSVMTKRNTKTVKLNDGKTKTVLDGVPKLIYGKTKDEMKQLLEDVETTLANENVLW